MATLATLLPDQTRLWIFFGYLPHELSWPPSLAQLSTESSPHFPITFYR